MGENVFKQLRRVLSNAGEEIMEFRFSPEDEALRREAAEFVRREWTVETRDLFNNGVYTFHVHEDLERVQDFAKRLAQRGWWVMHWPKEYGGQGVSVNQKALTLATRCL